MLTFLKKLLGFIWLLPATSLVWLFYILPLWAFKEIKYEGRADTFVWVFENPINPKSLYDKAWSKWAGWSGPCVYIYKRYTNKDYPRVHKKTLQEYNRITRVHELRHCDQQFLFGAFHYPLYFAASGWILLSNLWKPERERKHAHLDNPFEKDARRHAGQRVDIPREEWSDGPKDYNPWL